MSTKLKDNLGPLLSSSASIVTADDGAEHWDGPTTWWSDYRKKMPAAVVRPATEYDVLKAVTYACQNDIRFVTKGGGHSMGFSSIESPGIVVDLTLMRNVSIESESNVLTAQGGATIQDGLSAAAAAGLSIATGTCDSVGLVGSTLGGGIGRWFGYWGYAADNVLSMRVVVVGDSGESRLVDASPASNPDLFWGLRGNGHLFGVVTEARFQAYPWEHVIWHSTLVFDPSKAAMIAEELDGTHLTKEMHGRLSCIAPLPDHKPIILLQIWYIGPAQEAAHKFAGLLNLPRMDEHSMAFVGHLIRHDFLNHSTDPLCTPGGRKNISAFLVDKLGGNTFTRALKEFTNIASRHPGAGMAHLLIEFYSPHTAQETDKDGTETSIPRELRQLARYYVMPLAWYQDPALDDVGVECNRRFRQAFLTDEEGQETQLVEYINMASESATTASVFKQGERVEKLKRLKAKWDPLGVIRGIVPLPS